MSQHEPHTINQRDFYRVTYPERERPCFISDDQVEYSVIDISERGMRLLKKDEENVEIGTSLQGSVVLNKSGRIDVLGVIIRDAQDSLAILLRVGIPFSLIINEQQYLLQLNKYID